MAYTPEPKDVVGSRTASSRFKKKFLARFSKYCKDAQVQLLQQLPENKPSSIEKLQTLFFTTEMP